MALLSGVLARAQSRIPLLSRLKGCGGSGACVNTTQRHLGAQKPQQPYSCTWEETALAAVWAVQSMV